MDEGLTNALAFKTGTDSGYINGGNMNEELQKAFALVDEACASVQVNRATNRAIEQALLLIHAALQPPAVDEETPAEEAPPAE